MGRSCGWGTCKQQTSRHLDTPLVVVAVVVVVMIVVVVSCVKYG